MSYSDIFHDYINDIPMDLGRKFYATPNINVDLIQIPDRLIFSNFEYNFEAESRAREQFDKQNETIIEESSSTVTTSTPGTASQSSSEVIVSQHVRSVESGLRFGGLSQEVLVPCRVDATSSVNSKPLTPNTVSLPHSLHEFESVNNVFDDLQISALDDRKALQEVLMNTNSSTQSSSSSPLFFNNSINNNPEKVTSLPQLPKTTTKEKVKDNEELRTRLLTKGYRQDIVEKALSSLPKNRLVHIEYYMKACRTVEKTGRSTVDNVLAFLINCSLTDKHDILTYSETCANLLKMGFDDRRVFETVSSERGDQNKAISRLLPA